jgi:hypothetical protein
MLENAFGAYFTEMHVISYLGLMGVRILLINSWVRILLMFVGAYVS